MVRNPPQAENANNNNEQIKIHFNLFRNIFRAFFRRAVQSKYYEIFFCSKDERCEINLKTRRSCQFCRFKKCLAAGMRTAWVLPDGERRKRFNKLNKIAFRNNFANGSGNTFSFTCCLDQ